MLVVVVKRRAQRLHSREDEEGENIEMRKGYAMAENEEWNSDSLYHTSMITIGIMDADRSLTFSPHGHSESVDVVDPTRRCGPF